MNEFVNVSILFETETLWKVGLAMGTMRRKGMEKFEESMITLQDMIRIRTPWASGELRRSINYEINETTPTDPYGFKTGLIGFEGVVRSMRPGGVLAAPVYFDPWTYLKFVEGGTAPHWPPWEPLLRWVRTVLNPPGMVEELWTTFKIGRHISQKGTPGRHMFKLGEQEFEAGNILETNMKEAADEALEILTAPKPWWMF